MWKPQSTTLARETHGIFTGRKELHWFTKGKNREAATLRIATYVYIGLWVSQSRLHFLDENLTRYDYGNKELEYNFWTLTHAINVDHSIRNKKIVSFKNTMKRCCRKSTYDTDLIDILNNKFGLYWRPHSTD